MVMNDDMERRVRDALRDNLATSRFADYLVIKPHGSTIDVSGTVDDVNDSYHVEHVVSEVDGVERVVDHLETGRLDEAE